MNLFQRILNFFSTKPGSDRRHFTIYVLSRRCNEPLTGQVDLMNELSQSDDGDHPYFARKVIHTSGRNRCFDQVEIQLWFDKDKKLANHEESGGRWLTAAEYETELARFNTPPEDASTQ